MQSSDSYLQRPSPAGRDDESAEKGSMRLGRNRGVPESINAAAIEPGSYLGYRTVTMSLN
jgi:hypothetical protein